MSEIDLKRALWAAIANGNQKLAEAIKVELGDL